jgi:hypothetical protein
MEPPQSKSSGDFERRYVSHRLPYLSSQRLSTKISRGGLDIFLGLR